MLITPTLDKLHALNLSGMARALTDQLARAEYAALGFEERLGLLVDRERPATIEKCHGWQLDVTI